MINKNYNHTCKNCQSHELDSLNPDKDLWCGVCGQRYEVVNGSIHYYKGVKRDARTSNKKDTKSGKAHKRR